MMNPAKIQEELDKNRRLVSFDSYDITVRQIYDMICEGAIDIAPEYQRHFVWDALRQSQLIESLLLGIPIPSVFMATNKDATWEVVDGLQRLTTIVNFIGDFEVMKKVNPLITGLTVTGLEKLPSLNGANFDTVPKTVQTHFLTRPLRVTVLNDKSDFAVRYDLFERLNTGGITLHPQEIRNCVFLGRFSEVINRLANNRSFRRVVKTKDNYEELVLKFFAYYQNSDSFSHSVKEFLNEYMKEKTARFEDEGRLVELFTRTFDFLAANLPQGIVRGNRINITPLILFEAIAIGVAKAIEQGVPINPATLLTLLDNPELKSLTTGATNSKPKLDARINYVLNSLSQ